MQAEKNDLMMKTSYEVMAETIGRNTNCVAQEIGLTPSQIRKWKEAPRTIKEPDNSGSYDPLDRINKTIKAVKKNGNKQWKLLIEWLCIQNGFVPPLLELPNIDISEKDIIKAVLEWHAEIGESCEKINQAIEDGKITQDEYDSVQKELFEDLEKGMAILYLFKREIDMHSMRRQLKIHSS